VLAIHGDDLRLLSIACRKLTGADAHQIHPRRCPSGQFREPIARAKVVACPSITREPAMPLTPEREIEIEQELARIEREIDREIAHNRKRSLKWKVVRKPPLTPPDQNEH
jgi:hypothetical protein